jgi:hypothetical protein
LAICKKYFNTRYRTKTIINNGNNVVDSISHLCSSVSSDEGGDVEINILYQNGHHAPDFDTVKPSALSNEVAPHFGKLAGCTVTLLSEHDATPTTATIAPHRYLALCKAMSRFQRLAKLRSLATARAILSRQQEATQQQIGLRCRYEH